MSKKIADLLQEAAKAKSEQCWGDAVDRYGAVLKLGGTQKEWVNEVQAACQELLRLADMYNERMEFAQSAKCFQLMHRYYDHLRFWEPQLLFMHYDPSVTSELLGKAHREWGRRMEGAVRPHMHDPARHPRHERLRIGYVSPDCRYHPVASFFAPVLQAHDRSRFHIYCYTNTPCQDAMTEQLKGYAEEWRLFSGQTDAELIRQILSDEIDILVDLAGHTEYNRLSAFACKPAPVQVTWLGYPDTTGLTAIDYRLTDGWADPVGMTDGNYTEELYRLPESFLCYSPLATPELAVPPAVSNGYVTFGSFNRLKKITPDTLRLWAKVLAAVPKSRLFMKGTNLDDPWLQDHIGKYFCEAGVGRERLKFASLIPSHEEHLRTFNQVDIVLDPLRYSGTTSTCEALWMGVPVVTLAGDIHVSRVSSSLLTNVGLPALVAGTEKQYVRIAAELAANCDVLRELKMKLRERMRQSSVMNGSRFTRSLEHAYRIMWNRWMNEPSSGNLE